MIELNNVKQYCSENPILIENYEQATSDKNTTWHCHHRLETDLKTSRQDLIDKGLYYNRPASELIFLTRSEHVSIHNKAIPTFSRLTSEEMNKYCNEQSVRMKQLYKDHPEIGKKISAKLTGIKRTPEQLQHYKDSYTDERRQNISKVTIETNRKHTGEKAYVYNRKWISNGVEEKLVSKSEILLFLNKGYKLGRL